MLLFIGFLTLSFVSPNSMGDVKEDLAFIMKNNPIETKIEKKTIDFDFHQVSEIKLISLGFFRLYQEFISSQDKAVCNFTLSCSRFGVSSIQKFGFIHGLLMTSDRLQRCNGLGKLFYPFDLKTGLAIDYPIDSYYLGDVKK